MKIFSREFVLFLMAFSASLAFVFFELANAVTVTRTDATATFDISGLDVNGNPTVILDVELVLSPVTAINPDAAGGIVRSHSAAVNTGANMISLAPLLLMTPDGEYRLWARTRTEGAVSAWCMGDTIELDIPPEAPSGLIITSITEDQ